MSFIKNIDYSETSDQELAQLYHAEGDLEVLGKLYQRYMDLLYGVCLKYLKDDEKAKDAVMQVFEELIIKLRKHQVNNIKGWLYQVTKNHCLMQLRSGKKENIVNIDPSFMQNEENGHLQDVMEREEKLDNLQDCIEKLQGDQQKLIRLFYLEEKCYQEIADSTGHSWNQVRSHIQNGRRNLKICMENKLNNTETSKLEKNKIIGKSTT